MKKEKLGKILKDLTNPEKNVGGRPKAFVDDVCVVLPMSVPGKEREMLKIKWNKDLDKFRVKK